MNSYDDSELQQSTFTDNKPTRTGFNILFYFTVILVIFSIGVSIGVVWITMGFDKRDHPNVSTYDPDKDEYKSYKAAIMSGLGLCVSTCICLIILAVIFFIYLEEGFLLSEKLSNNLGIAVGAKDHADSFAELLGSLVFREPGQNAQRAEFADNMKNQMIKSYRANYNISDDKQEYYDNLYKDRLNQPLKEQPAPISDFARSRQAFSNDARRVGNVPIKGIRSLSSKIQRGWENMTPQRQRRLRQAAETARYAADNGRDPVESFDEVFGDVEMTEFFRQAFDEAERNGASPEEAVNSALNDLPNIEDLPTGAPPPPDDDHDFTSSDEDERPTIRVNQEMV